MNRPLYATAGPYEIERVSVPDDDGRMHDAADLSGSTWGGFARFIVRMNGDATDNPEGWANAYLARASRDLFETLAQWEVIAATTELREAVERVLRPWERETFAALCKRTREVLDDASRPRS